MSYLPPIECWKPVPGYEGAYSVSDCGRVRSENRTVRRRDGRPQFVRERVLKATVAEGYRVVSLAKPGSGQLDWWKVHHLVALAFIGSRPTKTVLRHLDGDSLNNCVTNLAYGTHAENTADSVAQGTHSEVRKTACPRGHELRAPNLIANRYKARGTRQCLACNRACTWGRKRGMDMFHPAVIRNANDRYQQIMQES